MTAPTPGTRADSDPLAAANRWLDRHGDTITHRGTACSVLNNQELAELVHAVVAAACDQARAEVVAAWGDPSTLLTRFGVALLDAPVQHRHGRSVYVLFDNAVRALASIREADPAAALAAHDRHVRAQALRDAADALEGLGYSYPRQWLRARADAEEAGDG